MVSTGIILGVTVLTVATFGGVAAWFVGSVARGAMQAEDLRAREYPQLPTGLVGPRMKSCPYSMLETGTLLNIFIYECAREYEVRESRIREGLEGTNVEWVLSHNHYIVDEWGRKIQGDLRGLTARVVTWPDATLRSTAFCYELLRVTKRWLGHGDWNVANTSRGGRWPAREWDLLNRILEAK